MGISRNTKSLEKINQEFDQADRAISVVDLVKRFDTEMNKTTVYRILDRLEDEGKLHSFIGRKGIKWYAKCVACSSAKHRDTHAHFQCNICCKVECLPSKIQVPKFENIQVESMSLLLSGLCADCNKKS